MWLSVPRRRHSLRSFHSRCKSKINKFSCRISLAAIVSALFNKSRRMPLDVVVYREKKYKSDRRASQGTCCIATRVRVGMPPKNNQRATQQFHFAETFSNENEYESFAWMPSSPWLRSRSFQHFALGLFGSTVIAYTRASSIHVSASLSLSFFSALPKSRSLDINAKNISSIAYKFRLSRGSAHIHTFASVGEAMRVLPHSSCEIECVASQTNGNGTRERVQRKPTNSMKLNKLQFRITLAIYLSSVGMSPSPLPLLATDCHSFHSTSTQFSFSVNWDIQSIRTFSGRRQ